MSGDPRFAEHERWLRVEAIALAALDRPPDERATLLARWCGDDVVLRREIESLLRHAEVDPAFLAAPLVVHLGALLSAEAAPRSVRPEGASDTAGRERVGAAVEKLGSDSDSF